MSNFFAFLAFFW